ncbi:protein Mpv17-like [Dioscorea cayenensis subsp. rotundata]|uniref:Protein Mpv17-like n=1 Tax=Dioscorea cayennensis subsp. rotundata TaxID=55577 RepID=A0AB40C3M7_DIOCR|nr:protein Mpv17-like [Dioscorea cayenensis subsp. rotundata]
MASILLKTLNGFGAITSPPKSSPFRPNSTRISPISWRNSYSRFGFSVHSRNPLFDDAFSVGFGDVSRAFLASNVVSSGGSGGDWGFPVWDDVFVIFQWYLMALDEHPVLTDVITSAFLTLIGDIICQLVIEQASKLDLKRSLIFTTVGFVLVGPTLHFWYLSLSNLVTTTGASGAFLRVLLDQFLFTPIFIGVFLSLVIILEGRPSQVVPKLKQEWPSTLVANWQLWIPCQFLIFLFVPQQFQVLAANSVALVWNAILSFKANKEVVLK